MSSCSIKWCGKTSKSSSSSKDGITFHRFPKDPDIKDAWITATKRENWFPKAYSVICSRHFTSDCFEPIKKRRRLFASAIPTLLLPLLGASEDKTQSDDEEPSISAITQNSIEDSVGAKDEHTNTQTTKNEVLIKTTDSTSKKVLGRKITDLITKLNKTKLAVKRLHNSNSQLKIKVNTMKNLLQKLKNKELLTQENIDIHRLQNSNRQLRKKVIWLKRLLNEEKKKNLGPRQNVVWCPAAE